MANEACEKHLLAGLDERARGFTRMVSVEQQAETFRASLQYETFLVVSADTDSPTAALADLARRLHERGYTQLRSRLTFDGSTYRGSQEQWVEYADPERAPEAERELFGLMRRIRRMFTRRSVD
ncbi:MAG TPA: hypothetical protein VE201_00090 [Nitrospirales bacterium]|jgi:hypothetical protein|nr:hypothetical protein [Nitrospirales bacterium]